MEWSRTSKHEDRKLRILIHGQSGAGKTWMARTVPDPSRCRLIAIEPGELSLADIDMPMVRLSKPSELDAVCKMLALPKNAAKFDWVYLDSLHALAEEILVDELSKNKDGRAAYGEMQRKVIGAIRDSLNMLPQHVVCTCRQERVLLDGRQVFVPGLPGQTLTHKSPIAHEFDAVWALVVQAGKDGEPASRWLLTDASADPSQTAKTRDPWGTIEAWERPDLASIAARLLRAETKTDNSESADAAQEGE